MYTELAKEKIKLFSKSYPNLYFYYIQEMGNFCLSEEELKENLVDVLNFLKDFSDYFLLHQEDKFYITNFID